MSDIVERAERAADLADRRARDADRIARWMVGIGLALVAAILITLLNLRSDVNGLQDDVSAIRRLLSSSAVPTGG